MSTAETAAESAVMEPGASEAVGAEGMPLPTVVIKVSSMIEIPIPVTPPGTVRGIVPVARVAIRSVVGVSASSQANHQDKRYCQQDRF